MSAAAQEISIRINDEMRRFTAPITVLGAINELGLGDRRGIAVAINETVVSRSDWPVRMLSADERLIIIQATQGG